MTAALRPPKPISATMPPATAPPAAPARFIRVSASPCTSERCAAAVDSVSSVEPATVAQDQPRPSRNRPVATAHGAPPAVPAVAAVAAAQTWTAWPTRITRTRPSRSVSHPTSGDSAYIPAMCRLMLKPTALNAAPWWVRCSGAMVITDTITAWPRTTADRPSSAGREVRTCRTAATIRVRNGCGGFRGRRPGACAPARAAARRSGSGRSRNQISAAPARKAPTEKTKVPASSGSPRARATGSPGPLRLGPMTLPTVVDHTTRDRARARWASSARSAAA